MTTAPTHTRWLIVTLIFCIGVLMFIDRVNISIAAKYIMPEYGLSDVQMGWIFSAFVFGYAVLQIPGGTLGDSSAHDAYWQERYSGGRPSPQSLPSLAIGCSRPSRELWARSLSFAR